MFDNSHLQAAWARLGADSSAGADACDSEVLCLLQPGLLSICGADGELQDAPLLQPFEHLWPLPEGLLLSVRNNNTLLVFMLCYPLGVEADSAANHDHYLIQRLPLNPIPSAA